MIVAISVFIYILIGAFLYPWFNTELAHDRYMSWVCSCVWPIVALGLGLYYVLKSFFILLKSVHRLGQKVFNKKDNHGTVR